MPLENEATREMLSESHNPIFGSGEGRLLPCRRPAFIQAYIDSVADAALVFEDALSDFGVTFWDIHVGLLESFLLASHCTNKNNYVETQLNLNLSKLIT